MRGLLTVLCAVLTALASGQRFYFEQFDVLNGKVYSVVQDSTGIVWLGTEAGLQSLDGNEEGMRTYNTDEGLATNAARCLLLDNKKRLWVGHSGGGLSLRTGRSFRTLQLSTGALTSDITGLVQDPDGSIWVTTIGQGAFRLTGEEENGKMKAEHYGPDHGLLEYLVGAVGLRDGSLIVLEDGGTIKKWDAKASRFAFAEFNGLENVQLVTALFEDSNGRLWMGTQNQGAYCLDPRSGQVVNYSGENGLPVELVNCFGEDGAGQVWVGTWGGGIAVIGLNGVRRHYFPGNGLESLAIRMIVRDREGNMLIATNDNGLNVFKGERFLNLLEQDGLRDKQVWAIMEDQEGHLWFGTDGGLSILDPTAQGPGMVKTVVTKVERVRSICQDPSGTVWVGSETVGVNNCDPSGFLGNHPEDINSVIPSQRVTAMIAGRSGEIWIGTIKGLRKYKPGTPPYVYDENDGVPTTAVTALYLDDHGTLWIGSGSSGISRIPEGKVKAAHLDLDRSFVPTCFVQGTDGRTWVGTENSGLLVLKNDKIEKSYGTADGLLSNTIRSLIRDPEGHIWAGTAEGLNKWRPQKDGFLSYTERSGFLGVEAKANSVCAARNGDLWFGTANGATRVVPEKGADKSTAPIVAIRSLSVDLEDRPIDQGLKLSHSERNLRFAFSSVSLSDPGAVRYSYMMTGLDEDWQPEVRETSARYPALPPGEYTFKVKAMNRSGLWSEPASFSFTILPPWYRSWWFYTAVVAIGAVLLLSWIKFRERQLRLRNMVLEQKVVERTAEVVKQSREIEKQKDQIEDLLLNILPEEVADELKENGKATARKHEQVTVLFTDMKGFTRIAEKMTPEELVSELHDCFLHFDDVMDKYGIEKIKTIGDSYMCAAGVPTHDPGHAHKTVLAALEIRDLMNVQAGQRRGEGREPWILRIGVHTGPVVAGVVGKRKFAYDIWGDAVNTASRMESSGEPGEVNISGATYQMVKDRFECEYRGKIQAKNKGEIDMYFVKRIKPGFSADASGSQPNERFLKELHVEAVMA